LSYGASHAHGIIPEAEFLSMWKDALPGLKGIGLIH